MVVVVINKARSSVQCKFSQTAVIDEEAFKKLCTVQISSQSSTVKSLLVSLSLLNVCCDTSEVQSLTGQLHYDYWAI